MTGKKINTKKLHLQNLEKLKFVCKMIFEIKSGLSYWKLDQVWPTNLYFKTLEKICDLLNEVIFSNDFSDDPEKKCVS